MVKNQEEKNAENTWEKALYELAAKDDKLNAFIKSQSQIEEIVPESDGDSYLAIVASIISQQLSVKAADTIYGRLEALFPGGVIDIAELNKIDDETLRSIGLSARKVKSIKDFGNHILDERLPEASLLMKLQDDEIISLLCDVYGIGRWTAEVFLISQLGRMDVLPVGDLIIRRGFARIFHNTDSPAEIDEVRTYANKWKPYRTAAAQLLWMAGTTD